MTSCSTEIKSWNSFPLNSSKSKNRQETEDISEKIEEVVTPDEESTSQGGALYNHYRFVRNHLRKAGILQLHKKKRLNLSIHRSRLFRK